MRGIARRRTVRTTLVVATTWALAAASAFALADDYGGYNVGPNGYVTATGGVAHTWVINIGTPGNPSTAVACQLSNSMDNWVDHGIGDCENDAGGTIYYRARVYNQATYTDVISGYAAT
jgi:maltoporin